MKKKTKIGIGAGIAIILLALIFKPGATPPSSSSDSPATVSLVSASDFKEVEGYISAVGEVESVDQVTLSSEVSGTVQAVYAEIGDYVVAGQNLVKLESGSYDAQLAQAAASIDRAQAALDQALAGATDEEVAQAAASVAQAEASLASSEVAYDQAVLSAQQSIDDAAAALATAENNLRQAEDSDDSELVEQEYIDLVNTIKASYTVMTDVLEDSDEVLGIENESVNDSFEDFLSAGDAQPLSQAENSYHNLKDLRDEHLDEIDELSSSSEFDVIEDFARKAENMLELAESHLYDMVDLMNETPSSAALPATTINTYVGIFTINLTSVQTKIGALSDDREAVEAALVNYANAQITYDAELLDYDQAQLAAEQSVAAAQASLDVQNAALAASQAAYDLLTADPREVDLGSLKASVAEAQAAYQLAAVNQGKTLITAPISGQVSVMNLREGDLVGASQMVVSLVNVNQLQVTAYISAEDLKWIRIGDPVLVNESIEAEVYRVSPSINPSTRKVEIQVLITAEDSDVTVGEFVTIEVLSSLVEEENEQYFLPLASIKVSSSKSYVYIVNDDGLVEQKEVVLGDVVGESVEVLSGLTAEDQFLSSVRGISVGDRVNVLNAATPNEEL